MAEVAHGRQMEEHRPTRRADELGGGNRRVVRRRHVKPVGREVREPGPGAVRTLDPAGRCADRNAQAVVLADEQNGHRQPLVGGVERGIDRTGRGGVIGRRVAERADHHRVAGPRRIDTELGRPVQRDSQADRARQVRRDRRGLWNHRQRSVAEDLVPAAGDRFVSSTEQALQNVADRCRPGYLRRPGLVETTRPVVQQRRIRRPKRGRDRSIALVTRRADGVEAPALSLQGPGREIEMPTGGLGVEKIQCSADRQRAAGADWRVRGDAGALGRPQPRDGRPKRFIECVAHSGSRNCVSGSNSTTSICAFCSRPE